MNVVFLHNFADNWIQYPRGIISPRKNTKPSKQTGRNPKKFVSVSTYYICAIRRLIWMCSMSVGIMPDWLTRPKTKIIASKKNNKSNHGGYAQTHSHTHTGTHYRPTDAFKHIYSYRRRTIKLLADLYLLVELSLNVMEVWRFRLITVLSTSQLLQPVSCQREWMWRSQDGLEVRPPSRYFSPPLHFKLGFLYSYFNGFIFFFLA